MFLPFYFVFVILFLTSLRKCYVFWDALRDQKQMIQSLAAVFVRIDVCVVHVSQHLMDSEMNKLFQFVLIQDRWVPDLWGALCSFCRFTTQFPESKHSKLTFQKAKRKSEWLIQQTIPCLCQLCCYHIMQGFLFCQFWNKHSLFFTKEDLSASCLPLAQQLCLHLFPVVFCLCDLHVGLDQLCDLLTLQLGCWLQKLMRGFPMGLWFMGVKGYIRGCICFPSSVSPKASSLGSFLFTARDPQWQRPCCFWLKLHDILNLMNLSFVCTWKW